MEEAGEGSLVTYMRSSAKPFQALPLTRARADLDSIELAIASASHVALPAQLDAVRRLLGVAEVGEDDLECGPEGHPPARINHNCSGKHAGMLALCAACGWPTEGYRLAGHPVQEAAAAELAAAAEVPLEELRSGIDGCGVVTWALPLERMAFAFSRLSELEGGTRVAEAMRAHPELVRGRGAPDTVLMQSRPGWVAKGGAEGLMCAVGPDGLGIALKVADGAARAVGPALGAFLRQLGQPVDELLSHPLENSRGERIGEVAAEDEAR